MDPNANLAEQQSILRDLAGPLSSLAAFANYHHVSPATWDTCGMGSLRADYLAARAQDRARLRELRAALAAWRRGGGFAPVPVTR